MISSLLHHFNHAPVWRGEMNVWQRRMSATSFDRLLYLGLHRSGWMGKSEAQLLHRLVRPGMRVVDVGANVGLYSLLLSELVGASGSVLAFEPEPGLCATLMENCNENGAANITVWQRALSSRNGAARLERSSFNSGDNRLGTNGVEVECVRFDDLALAGPLDFIKIDVQGHELDVLLGMENVLATSPKVRVLFEFCPSAARAAGSSVAALLDFFRARGFEIFQTSEGALRPLVRPESLIAATSGHRYLNLLASRSPFDV